MNSYGSLEDNAEGDMDCGGVTHEDSESSKDIINNWTMDHLCYTLAKNCGRWWCGAEDAAVTVKKCNSSEENTGFH